MPNDQIGIFNGVSFEEYVKIDALNGSSLVHMRRSPMHYRHMCDNPQPATSAQKLGVVTHQLVLEPHRAANIAIWGEREEEKVRRGKVWDAFQAEYAGSIIVTKAECAVMAGMVTAAHKSQAMRKYLNADGDTEVTMVWRDSNGRLWKGRCDKVIPVNPTIIDLKTTRDCHPFRFGAQAYTLSYHIKAAIYVAGYHALTGARPKFKFLAIDSKPPHESAVYRCTPDVLLQGGADCDELVRKLSECETSGYWPPDQEQESDLTLPNYAYQTEDEFADQLFAETE
jgi:PDDEXK-like domain of unknown function (DUF3799)